MDKDVIKDVMKNDNPKERIVNSSNVGFLDELQIPQHISKVHNKWLASELVSEDYIFAKLQTYQKDFIVNDINNAMRIGGLIERMIERYKSLPFPEDIINEEVAKLKDKSALITQKSKIKSDMMAILERNVSNNHMMNHVRGAEDRDETNGTEGLPENIARLVDKHRGKGEEDGN